VLHMCVHIKLHGDLPVNAPAHFLGHRSFMVITKFWCFASCLPFDDKRLLCSFFFLLMQTHFYVRTLDVVFQLNGQAKVIVHVS